MSIPGETQHSEGLWLLPFTPHDPDGYPLQDAIQKLFQLLAQVMERFLQFAKTKVTRQLSLVECLCAEISNAMFLQEFLLYSSLFKEMKASLSIRKNA